MRNKGSKAECGEEMSPQGKPTAGRHDVTDEGVRRRNAEVQMGEKSERIRVGCAEWMGAVAHSKISIDEVQAFSVRMNVA